MSVHSRNQHRKLALAIKQMRRSMQELAMPTFRVEANWAGGRYHVPISVPVVIDEAAYPPVINSGAAIRAASERAADRAIRAEEPVYPFFPWNVNDEES